MSHTLHCDFVVESERSPIYWWPLIFEAMQRQSFYFSSPDFSKGISHYYYHRLGKPSDSDIVTGSFKNLWNEIYSEINEEMMVWFWSTGEDYFNLNVSVIQDNGNHAVRFHMTFAGALVMFIPLQEARDHLQIVLDCAKTLYQTCKPCKGEVYWEYAGDVFAPWVTFGKQLEFPSPGRPMHNGPDRKVVQQELLDSDENPRSQFDFLYLLDPVPIPRNVGGWDFISLGEEDG